MINPNTFVIACNDPADLTELAERVTVAPLCLLEAGSPELVAGNYQAEGAIVPNMERRRALTAKELGALAVSQDTPHALSLVRVPRDIGDLMDALHSSKPVYEGPSGAVIFDDRMLVSQAPPGTANATINPGTGERVACHIDAIVPGIHTPESRLMAIAAGPGGRSLVVAPSIHIGDIPEELRESTDPTVRAQRRACIRELVRQQLAEGEVLAYILRLDAPSADTYAAYINMASHKFLHDGLPDSTLPSKVVLLSTQGIVRPGVFPSLV